MKEVTLQATTENTTKVLEFIDNELEINDCSIKAQSQIDIAVDELFGNIVNYAYTPDVGEATVQVEFKNSNSIIEITMIDSGKPYNPLAKDDPDVSLGLEDRKVGGLGIFMAKKLMDTIEYNYKNNQNILKISKSII